MSKNSIRQTVKTVSAWREGLSHIKERRRKELERKKRRIKKQFYHSTYKIIHIYKMEPTKDQKRLAILYEAQDEIKNDTTPSPKKEFLINMMINQLEEKIISGKTKGI